MRDGRNEGGNVTNYNGSKANRREQRRVKNRVHECSVAGRARGGRCRSGKLERTKTTR